MNWAEKLSGKVIEEGAETKDFDGRQIPYAHKGDCVLIDDYDSAVLKKNEQLHKEADFDPWGNKIKTREARAFREQVAEVKKRKAKS